MVFGVTFNEIFMEETTETLGKGIYYNHTLTDDKHYFGGFLNLAQNNIDTIFKAFAKRFNIDATKKNNATLLNDYFAKPKITITDYEIGIAFFKQYFPVLHYLYLPVNHEKFVGKSDPNKERRAYFIKSFKSLLTLIDNLRNFYSHYYHKPITISEDNHKLLEELFLQVIPDVRKFKMKGEATRHLLKKDLNTELQQLMVLKKAYLKEQKKGRFSDPVSVENGVLNDAFIQFTTKDGEIQSRHQSLYSGDAEAENGITISQNGLAFLMGMFLTRKQSEDLRSKLKGHKAKIILATEVTRQNNSLKNMATHWVYGYLCYKGYKEKLTTTFSKETLLVQIVDELSKVPDALYQSFTKEQQDLFVEDINEYIKEGNAIASLEESTVMHPVIRKRYENKFNYFVLRYLDEFADFPSLRFQVHLGNYVHDSRSKEIAGTTYSTQRTIKEKIKVFGKLSEISGIKAEYFLKNQTEDITGWEQFPNPSYNFVGENIPIFIDLHKSIVPGASDLGIELSKIKAENKKKDTERNKQKERNTTKARKLAITQAVHKKAESKPGKYEHIYTGEPTALLSCNELPALLFEHLIHQKTGEELERVLIEKLLERHRIIAEYGSEDNLSNSQISRNLKRASSNEVINTAKLIRALTTEIAITNDKLALVKQQQKDVKNPRNKRNYVFTNKEMGQHATWLADDLKRFMPQQYRMQWKGHHHSLLQELLAYYNQKPNEALNLLNSVWDFSADTPAYNHGIAIAFMSKQFDGFYYKYLENRKKTLLAIKAQIIGFTDNKKVFKKFIVQQGIFNIFHKRLMTDDSLENQKIKLLAKPLVLPRGIFDVKPTYIKGVHFEDNREALSEWHQYCYSHSDYQKFYSLPRDYQDLSNSTIIENTENKYNLTEVEKFELFKRKQDKKIKKVQYQDVFLLQIANTIFEKTFEYKPNLQLSQLYLTQEERIQEEQKARIQSQRVAGDHSENIIKSNFVWTMTIPYVDENIDEPEVKIKDLGKFKRFLNDEKVKTILSYTPTQKWTKLALEQELEFLSSSYEVIRRDHLFAKIQEFEKYILAQFSNEENKHPEILEQEGNPNFKMYVANGILARVNHIPETDIAWIKQLDSYRFKNVSINELKDKDETTQKTFLLILIRNRFAHNQLPKKEMYELTKSYIQPKPESSISEIYLQFVEETIAEFKSMLG